MEYEKMYKKDLIPLLETKDQEIKNLGDRLKNNDDFESKYNAKKKEITRLTEEIRKLKQKQGDGTKLEVAQKEKRVQKAEHEKAIKDLKAEHVTKTITLAKQAETAQTLQDLVNIRTQQLNRFMAAHGTVLKMIQGTMDMAIEINENMSNDVVAVTDKYYKKE